MCFKNVFVEPAKYNAAANQQSDNTESQFPKYSNECSLDLFDPLSIFNETTSPMSLTSDSDFPVTDFYNPSQDRQDVDYGSKPIFCGYTRPPEYAYQAAFSYPGYLQTSSLGPEVNQFSRSPKYDQGFDFAVTPAKSLRFTSTVQTHTLCKVCGDVASGNHFGVLSCEACKSFFRRSVRAGARYACRASRRCAIEKLTRNRCQYCRLQKCILMGMKKEVVQEERTPPVSQLHNDMLSKTSTTLFQNSHLNDKSTHSYSLSSNTTIAGEPTSNLISKSRKGGSLPNLKITTEQETMPPSLDVNSSISSLIHSVESIPVTQNSVDSHVSASILVNADIQTDRLPVENVTTAEGRVTVEEIFEGARQSLMKVIEWGKQIPAFISLKLEDQIILLKSSWFEHVLMRLAMRIQPESGSVLLGSGITCFKHQIEDPDICRIIEQVSNDISYWFDTMHVDHVEMACLKGIILFNPDAAGLSAGTRKRVEIFQEQILQALETRCRTVYPATPLRFSKLLLRLAPLKTSALEATQHMEIQRTLCNTKMDDIFGELLDLH